mmetsp:Transcript_19551/g.58623  ORF Transcript_19551/g.58623 Transcript_19551/m.58623 type:complete len:294 (-) Transcript_19551:221-1102(-)
MDDSGVADLVGPHAVLDHPRQPPLRAVGVAGLHAGVHDDVVADGVGLYAAAAHPHEPLLCAPDVAPLGAGVDHGVVADRVRPEAAELDLAEEPLGLPGVGLLRRRVDGLVHARERRRRRAAGLGGGHGRRLLLLGGTTHLRAAVEAARRRGGGRAPGEVLALPRPPGRGVLQLVRRQLGGRLALGAGLLRAGRAPQVQEEGGDHHARQDGAELHEEVGLLGLARLLGGAEARLLQGAVDQEDQDAQRREPEDSGEPLGEGHPLAVIAAVELLGGALRLGPDGVHRDGDVVCLV